MKKLLIVIFIAVMVLIIPTPKQMKDGGTLHLDSLLYDVYFVNRINPEGADDWAINGDDFITGIVVEVLGNEIYNSTTPHIDIHE